MNGTEGHVYGGAETRLTDPWIPGVSWRHKGEKGGAGTWGTFDADFP